MRERAEREEARKEEYWAQFVGGLRRGRKLYASIRALDPDDPRLKILQHCCFACRMHAGHRLDADGDRSVSIGYAEGELSWLGAYKCGSGRFCLLCGAAIAIKNRKEIEEGLYNGIAKGYSCLLVTYTAPHRKTQSAMELVDGFSQARSLARKGGDLSRFRKKIGFVGDIVRQEETYGEHGWHPHIHEIFIVDHIMSEDEIKEISAKLKQKWHDACYKCGLVPSNRTKAFDEHGFDVQQLRTPKEVADYISKIGWRDSSAAFKEYAKKAVAKSSEDRIAGMVYEVGSHNSKAPRGDEGRTPWDIHKGFCDGDPEDIRLWLEYIEAFSGKPLVRWSTNLKAILGLEDKDEEEKVDADEDTNIRHIYKISEAQYHDGVAKNGLWLPILKAVEQHDYDTLRAFADQYGIDFRRPHGAAGNFPEILSGGTVERDGEEERRQRYRAAERRCREEAARLRAEQEAEERARRAAARAYAVSLLSPDEADRVRAGRKAHRLGKRRG